MHTALPYDISPITPSNFDTDFFLPKQIRQYCFLPSWWLSPCNQLAFILGYTGMQTAFSSHTKLFCKVQLVSLPRRQSVAPSEFVTNGELVVHGSKTEGSGRHWRALHGVTAVVCRQQKRAGRCLSISFLRPCSPLIILLGSHYQPPHLNWSMETAEPVSTPALCQPVLTPLIIPLPNRERFITSCIKLTRSSPLLIAPNLPPHTDYATISSLLNCLTSQLLTEQGKE